jgi:hypothetical protein
VSTKLGSIQNRFAGGQVTEADVNSIINQGEVSMRGTEYPMHTHGTGVGDSPQRVDDEVLKS